MSYVALSGRLFAVALLSAGAMYAQDWICRDSLTRSAEIRQWLVTAYGAPVDLSPLESRPFRLGTSIETLRPSQVTGAALDRSGSWRLFPDLPFLYPDKDGVPELTLDVDSFVYVIDKRHALFQVLAVGPSDLVLNAFWLREARFVVLFAEHGPSGDSVENTYAVCYDLTAMVRETYRPVTTRPLDPTFWKPYATALHNSRKGGV